MGSTEQEIVDRFSAFLVQMWLEAPARERSDRPLTQSEIARRIGIPQGSYNQYINKVRLPDEKNRDLLAAYYGPQVYDILEVPRKLPAGDLTDIAMAWDVLPKDVRRKYRDMILDEAEEWRERIKNPKLAGVVSKT